MSPASARRRGAAPDDPEAVSTIILCGGRGVRISEVNPLLPKPMLPIGERPVLWHIMKLYAHHGHNDFVLALGWLGEQIRRYFLDYRALSTNFRVRLGEPSEIQYLHENPEDGWLVSCVDTGLDAGTGARVRRAAPYAVGDTIMVTYGDGVAPVDIEALLAFHRSHGKLATVTAVRPPGRFGELMLDGPLVGEFCEKPAASPGLINGGFMVFEREAIEGYISEEPSVMLEEGALPKLAADGQLGAFVYEGWWQSMDTPRERDLLHRLWLSGEAPWKLWP